MRLRKKLWSQGRNRGKLAGVALVLGLVFAAYSCGRYGSSALAAPQPASKGDKPPKGDKAQEPGSPSESAADYACRPVAYIYGTIMIPRSELGEYLIAREGAEKLELLVNKRIIEHACKEKGIEVAHAEIEAALAQDLKELNVSQKDFEDKVLRRYRKTLLEWKEDVIWPKLALTKLCQSRVKVEPKDLDNAFEAYYGDKVEGRLIMFPKAEQKIAIKVHSEVRTNEEEFNRRARSQASQQLAADGGKIRPISRHSTGNDELEKEVFSLNPGEVSRVLGTPEGWVIFMCDRRIPKDSTVKKDQVKPALEKDILAKKVQAEIPKYFAELRKEAQPTLFLKKQPTEEDLLKSVREFLKPEQTGPQPEGKKGE